MNCQAKALARKRSRVAFTLIELLIVISIMAILASMVFPITRALNRTKIKTRARGELAQMETAIEAYKAKLGVYPPDNPISPVNTLYYELKGLRQTDATYQTLDGQAKIGNPAMLIPGVRGFVNCSRGAASDDNVPSAINFLKSGIKPNQVAELKNTVKILVCSVPWPEQRPPIIPGEARTLNPWRYVSTNPTNNPNGFDLWIDVVIDGKVNRIGNWSREPFVVKTP